ncbi:MAG: AraC family transcriptional regulator [Spirochaetia bacterium]|nr:AraC family transcriptional regulator [Spirochaetia bacterium]
MDRRFIGTTTLGAWELWVSLGNFLNFKGSRNGVHRHSYFEACLVLQGTGTFTYGTQQLPLRKGDLFVADPAVCHEIISDAQDHLMIHFISFSLHKTGNRTIQDLFDPLISAYLTEHTSKVSSCGELETLFQTLKGSTPQEDPMAWALTQESIGRSIVLQILLKTANRTGTVFMMDSDPRLEMALHFMRDNARRRLTIDEIANYACTSPRTLRRLMQDSCSMTVVQRCLLIRLQESARYLIAHPERSIAEVSHHFDFESPSDFGRVFRKVYEMSPGTYRTAKGTTFP